MKLKLLLVFLLLVIVPMAFAEEGSIVYVDTVDGADTTATTVISDTAFGGWKYVGDLREIFFYTEFLPAPGYSRKHLTADSFFVKVQTAFNRNGTLKTYELDTLLDTSSVGLYDEFTLTKTDSVFGDWIRLMLIHKDSIEADRPDSIGLVRGNKLNVWFQGER